jgi:hypothetical protein
MESTVVRAVTAIAGRTGSNKFRLRRIASKIYIQRPFRRCPYWISPLDIDAKGTALEIHNRF